VQSLVDDGPIDVSVCIVNWNCRELLRACLESLHDQPQGVRLETIVVDNGSSDGAAEMVARDFPEVILIRNSTNLGFARANNQAARRARGHYLFFLNNDTVVPAAVLRRLVDYADAHPEVGLVGPRLRDGEGRLQVSCRPRLSVAALLHRTALFRWTGLLKKAYLRFRRWDADPDEARRVHILMGAAMLLPREVFFTLGGWDEAFTFGGEDMDLSTRVGQHYAVVYLPQVEIIHHGRASTRQHPSYAALHIPTGFVRHLRKSGCSEAALLAYKVVVTLDAPINLAHRVLQYGWRRLRGRHAEARKSLLSVRILGYFLTRGLGAFWRA
jgi:GT2 family glycosyltransferase